MTASDFIYANRVPSAVMPRRSAENRNASAMNRKEEEGCSPSIVVHSLEGVFASYGAFVGGASTLTLSLMVAASLFVVAVLGGGMALLTPTADSEFLYTPVNSKAHKDRDLLRSLFPVNASGFGSFTVYQNDRSDIWTTEGIRIANDLHAHAKTITTTFKGDEISFEDVCERGSTGMCSIDVPMGCLSAWNANNSYVPETEAASALPFPVCVDMVQENGIFVPGVLGNPTTSTLASDASQTVVTEAEAIRVTYRLSYERDDDAAIERSAEWELAFTEQMDAYIRGMESDGRIPSGITATRLSERSLDDALEESVGGDFFFISLTFILMICLVAALTFSSDVVRNKSMLSLAAVTATGVAIPASFGLVSYIGVPFVSIVGLTPFLLLALGIDNALVIMATYLRTPGRMSASQRMVLTLRDAGVAITLTTTTDILAFCLGAISPFNAVRIFCLYTGVGILLAYLSMLFFFVPIMVLDARREEEGISSWTCQRVGPSEGEVVVSQAAPASAVAPKVDADERTATNGATVTSGLDQTIDRPSSPSQVAPAGASPQQRTAPSSPLHDDNYVGASWDSFFADYLGPAVLSTPGKSIIMVVWLAIIGVSAYGFSQLGQGLDLQQLAPDGHYFIQSQDAEVEFFNLGIPFQVLLPSGEEESEAHIDFTRAAVRDALSAYGPAIVSADSYAASSDEAWTDAFQTYLASGSTDLSGTDLTADQFRTELAGFLADSAASGPVLSGISLRDPRNNEIYKPVQGVPDAVAAMQAGVQVEVVASIVVVRSRVLDGDRAQADAMVSLRDTVIEEARRLERASEAAVSLNSGDIRLAQEFLVFFEQYLVIVSSTITTVGLAAVSILAVAALLLPRFKAVGIVVLALVSIFVMLFGFMTAVDIRLNTVSAINLVLAIGLSVDAVAHITHAFLTSPGEIKGVHSHLSSKSLVVVRSASTRWESEPWVGGEMRTERARAALEEMGRPVFQGGITSLLGLVLLYVGASSYIFTVFAALLISVIVLGMLHAIFVLPVLLSLFGPGPVLTVMEEGEEGGEEEGKQGTSGARKGVSTNGREVVAVLSERAVLPGGAQESKVSEDGGRATEV